MIHRLTVARAAEIVGCHPETLKRYESRGLIHPRRHPVSNWRIYDPAEVERLKAKLDGSQSA